MRRLLLPFNLLYRFAVFVRNELYNHNLLKITSVNASVISVGNISTGGTGKTPMTQYLAEYFLTRNKSVIIVMKGYKRLYDDIQIAEIGFKNEDNELTIEKLGDESLQLLENLADLKIEPGKGLLVVSDNKRSGTKLADKKFKPEIIIIDDAFQHRGIERDLDIVMLNNNESRMLLPAGNMREPFRNTRRADVLVLNKKFNGGEFSKLESKSPGIIVSNYVLENFVNARGEILGTNEFNEKPPVTAFCGIADPESFKAMLRNLDIDTENFILFPDHYNFKLEDIKKILDVYDATKAKYIITTQKDMIRLKYSSISGKEETERLLYNCPLYFAKIKLEILRNEDNLHDTLSRFIKM